MKALLAAVVCCVLATPAAAETPLPPPEVVKAVVDLAHGWGDPDAPPVTSDEKAVRGWIRSGAVKPVNMTPDARPDWLIDTEKTPYGNAWCGTGGCLVEIWSATPDGSYHPIFANQIRERHFRRVPGKTYDWMEVDFHGSMCGLTGVEPCPWGFEWHDDGMGQYGLGPSLRFFKGEITRPGPPPQALDPTFVKTSQPVPEAVQAFVAIQQQTCAASNGVLSDGLVSRMPDLNGDGVDDWDYDGLYATCDYSNDDTSAAGDTPGDDCGRLACESRLWLSQRSGDALTWHQADWDAGKVHAYRYRPGAPIQVLELDDAAGGEACDVFVIATCRLTPISLSPMAQN